MYRQYEDPYKVQRMLDEARDQLELAKANEEDEDRIISLHEDVAILEERLNFAWQDDEAACEGWD